MECDTSNKQTDLTHKTGLYQLSSGLSALVYIIVAYLHWWIILYHYYTADSVLPRHFNTVISTIIKIYRAESEKIEFMLY